MDILSNILSIVKPTGVWASIINAFEGGVGSYILAIVLITLIIRVILSPFDTVNKRISKKQAASQAKLQPEIQKLQKQYGNDKALLNQKTQELYKKSGLGVGGSCLFMLIFMALNLTIFFTLFSALNGVADYKINQQYLSIKDSYSNVLNLVNEYKIDALVADKTILFNNYENISFKSIVEGENTYLKAIDENNNEIYKTKYKEDFSYYKQMTTILNSGNITDKVVNYNNEYTEIKVTTGTEENKVTNYYYILSDNVEKNENNYILKIDSNLYKLVSSDQYIYDLIRTYINKEEVVEGQTSIYTYVGEDIVKEDITLATVIQTMAMKEVINSYELTQKENSFLWIGSIWVADSPFKNSIFTFDEYKNEIGANNVSSQEELIYNSFMTQLRIEKGRVNGYFILAIISIGVSFLAAWLGQKGNKNQNNTNQKTNKIMLFLMPVIMGIFAILYNSVFAIYLVVSQAISAAITPLSNFIIKKWDKHDEKKQQLKQTVVDYRRK